MANPFQLCPPRLAGLAAGLAVMLTGTAASALDARLPLLSEDLNLDGGRGRAERPVDLPPWLAVERALLTLGYANALALDPATSGLVVSLGDEAIAELPLIAAQGDVQADIEVPPTVLGTGSNPLRFNARQHHRAACDRGAFTELWTRIDAQTSYLELDVRPRAEGLTLANLDATLGASLYDGERFTVLAARPADDPALLAWGGLVAEGVALRRGERTVGIDLASLAGPGQTAQDEGVLDMRAIRGRNVVVLGTFEELGGALPSPLPDGAGLGLIAIQQLPADPTHVAVIISGENDAAVRRAAETFRIRRAEWPEANAMAITFGGSKQAPIQERASVVAQGGTVTLGDLGYATDDLPLSFTETIDVEVVLPDTYYAGDGQKLELGLDFAYGAGLAPTSALIIRLNGAPWNMLRLDQSNGQVVEDARVELPMGLFRPGRNVIGFEPVLHPANPELCKTIGKTAMFTLFDDSRLIVPRFASLARQPDLRLFATSGFPFAAADEGIEVVLGEMTPDAVAAAWTLRAKLAQRRGGPLTDVVTVAKPSGKRHILALGAPDDLPAELTQAAPLPFARSDQPAANGALSAERTRGAREHWSQRVLVDGGDDGNVFTALSRWVVSIARAMPAVSQPARPTFAELGAVASPGSGTMVAFRSPYADNRTATVITTAGGTLNQAVERLIEPAVWNGLDGDVSVWSGDTSEVLSHRVADPYVISQVDRSPAHLWLLWRTFMAERLGYWLILVFSMIGVLTLATGRLLKNRARRISG